MKLHVNWKRFWLIFGLLQVTLFLAGCSAAWLGAVSALLPTLESAVSAVIAFVMALEGKTISAEISSKVQQIGADIKAEIANVQTLIADYKNAASTGLLSQIQAVFQGIIDNLSSILTNVQVSDQTTVGKVTQLVGLAVSASQAIIALIPLVMSKLASGASKEELEAEDKLAASNVNALNNGLKASYVRIVTAETTNSDVNTALASLPPSI